MAWYDEIANTTKGNVQGLVNALRNPQDAIVNQFKQGALYKNKDALASLLRGDTAPIMNSLNTKYPVDPNEAVNAAMMLGTIKGVGSAPFQSALDLAQHRASFPVSEGGLGLPKNNTAMDRAKAQGYEIDPYWHSSDEVFAGSKEADDYVNQGYGDLIKNEFKNNGYGTYFAKNPDAGDIFNRHGYGSTAQYLLKKPNHLSLLGKDMSKDQIKELNLNLNNIFDKSDIKNIRTQLDDSSFKPVDSFYNGDLYLDTGRDYQNKLLKKYFNNGYTSLTIPDNLTRGGADISTVINDTSNIRSINAAFDPFRRNEADILAGVGAGVGLSSLNTKDEKNKYK